MVILDYICYMSIPFYFRYNTDPIVNTEIVLDPYISVIKRLWCTNNLIDYYGYIHVYMLYMGPDETLGIINIPGKFPFDNILTVFCTSDLIRTYNKICKNYHRVIFITTS